MNPISIWTNTNKLKTQKKPEFWSETLHKKLLICSREVRAIGTDLKLNRCHESLRAV